MTFANEKKTYLAKSDKSKKGCIDKKAEPIIKIINRKENYYTTSSCSGRVHLWRGTGKKNETERLKVSHDLIDEDFFEVSGVENKSGLTWLRLEGLIIHVACKNLEAADRLLKNARVIYKKSCILSVSRKFIVEIRDSTIVEMPLYKDGQLLFSGDFIWLKALINQKFKKIWQATEEFASALRHL